MVIDRDDNVINLCEMKFSPYTNQIDHSPTPFIPGSIRMELGMTV